MGTPLISWPGLTVVFSHYHQEMTGQLGALTSVVEIAQWSEREKLNLSRIGDLHRSSDQVFEVLLGAKARQGKKIGLAIGRHEFRRNEPWPAADSASARYPAAALIRDTASSLKIINWRASV